MNFEDYLADICFSENEEVLDDDRPDFFDNWLTELQADDWLDYGDRFLASQLPVAPVDPHNDL